MSRTDKDRPYRVRAADPHEPGRRARHASYRYWWKGSSCVDGCDLPDYHDRRPEPRYFESKDGRPTHECTWELEYWVYSPWGDTAPKWYTNHVWHAPERVRARDALRGAAREWNAHGDLEDFDFANYQGRHSATWSWM